MPQFLPIFDYIAPVKRFVVSCHCVSVRPRPVVVVATVAWLSGYVFSSAFCCI